MLEVESMQDMLLLPPRTTNECKTEKYWLEDFCPAFCIGTCLGGPFVHFQGLQVLLSIESWLLNKDPYKGALKSLYTSFLLQHRTHV